MTKKPHVNEIGFPIPMLHHLKLGDNIVVNDFIKFENLQDDFERICRQLNLPEIKLPHRNSSDRALYRDYYTDETRAVVAEKYAENLDF